MQPPTSREPVVFELSRPGRGAQSQFPAPASPPAVPAHLRRKHEPPLLPAVSELQAVRHFTRLSQLNFSIDTHFYPVGLVHDEIQPQGL
jgi:glycine dehydrogenase subunit 2